MLAATNTTGPVVGIAEAGMHAATLVGRSFSIVTTLGRTIGQPNTWCAGTGSPTSASVLLGCAGMADFAAEVSAQVGVPVIDGVTAGVVLVETLVRLGLRTSTRSEYAAPLPKDYR